MQLMTEFYRELCVENSQISDVRYVGPGRAEVLQLDGHLQWLTLAEEWAYFPERSNDHWGISKNSGDNDARVVAIAAQVRSKDIRLAGPMRTGSTLHTALNARLSTTAMAAISASLIGHIIEFS